MQDIFGSYAIETNEEDKFTYLRFTPDDPNNIDYDLKIIKTEFTTSDSGISTHSMGFIDLTSSNNIASSGITTTVFSKNIDEIESLFILTKGYKSIN